MAVEVHVTGRIESGRFFEFMEAVARWSEYRAAKGEATLKLAFSKGFQER